jgi:hypothetical protein
MRPKRASSKARTLCSACRALGGRLALRPALPYRRSFFESLLLLWVGFLVPRASRLELYLASSEELTDAVRMRVLDASLAQERVSLRDRGYLTPFHGLLEFFKGFGRNQLLATAFVYSAFQQLLESTLPVACKPPLALTPTVA